jgi:lipopolysaccharide/colanic/teichoic acid biosynthesis glycosyltransferase
MVTLLAAGYTVRQLVSRLALLYFGVLLFVGFILVRYGARIVLRSRYQRGDVSRVVIAGSGRIARELATKLARHPEMLCKVVGFLCPQESGSNSSSCVVPSVNSNHEETFSTLAIVELLRVQRVEELILALPHPAWSEVLNLAARCRESGINVSLIPQPYELYLSKPTFVDLEGLPVLQLRGPVVSPQLVFSKRVLDAVVAALLAVITLPVVLATAMILRRTKGRGFQCHQRCGLRGTTFSMFRLNIDRGEAAAPLFERVLERLSVTELPQLWNVLRGDMSLVGPRPESLDRVKRYSEWQQERLSVKPGMTGLAQVHGLREQNSSEEKTRFDLQYRLNPSLLTDISLLLQTVWTLAFRVLRYSRLVERPTPVGISDALQARGAVEVSIPEQSASVFMEEVLISANRSQSGAN